FSLVVMADRCRNQAIVSDRPLLEAADPDPATGPARAGVRSDKCPAVLDALALYDEVVHEHLQIRERDHERTGGLRDGGAPNRGRPVVDGKRTAGRVVLRHARRILAAPRVGVPPGELTQPIGRRRQRAPSWLHRSPSIPDTTSSS